MRLTRVYVSATLERGALLELPPDSGQHLARVLRARAGDPLLLFNGGGEDYGAVIDSVRGSRVTVLVDAGRPVHNESPLDITLVQSVARGEKMDFVVQKATELGVKRIVPVISRRSVVRLEGAQAVSKHEHWQAVAIAACEQCGRARVPTVELPGPLLSFLGELEGTALRLVFEVADGARRARAPLPAHTGTAVTIAIGPEGGFEADELEAFVLAGFTPSTLGPRILRTETAALAAIASLQAIMGDLSVPSDEASETRDS